MDSNGDPGNVIEGVVEVDKEVGAESQSPSPTAPASLGLTFAPSTPKESHCFQHMPSTNSSEIGNWDQDQLPFRLSAVGTTYEYMMKLK